MSFSNCKYYETKVKGENEFRYIQKLREVDQ